MSISNLRWRLASALIAAGAAAAAVLALAVPAGASTGTAQRLGRQPHRPDQRRG